MAAKHKTENLYTVKSNTEKKRIRLRLGKGKEEVLDVPYLLAMQVDSYEQFLQADVADEPQDRLVVPGGGGGDEQHAVGVLAEVLADALERAVEGRFPEVLTQVRLDGLGE